MKKFTVKANKNIKRGRKPIKAAKRMSDVFDGYEPWSGAKDTAAALDRFDKWDALEAFIDETYYNEEIGEGLIGETELNDLLWFEPEYIAEAVGLYYDVETDEWSDEPFEDEDEDGDVFESTSIRASNVRPLTSYEKKKCIEQIAYDYGVSKKQATQLYNEYTDERRRDILDGGKSQAKRSFYED